MLHMEASFSGGTIASHMSDDAEEFAEFLSELADSAGPSFIIDTSEYLNAVQARKVCQLLRELANAIEAAA